MIMKKKSEIIHVILSKGFSGSEKYVLDLARYQKKYYNVYVITLEKNIILNKLLKKHIQVFKINNFFKKYKIQKIINKIKPNIVHTHLGEAVKAVKKSSGYKVISTMHMNYKIKDYKNTDAIIVSNKTQFNEVSKTFKGKIFKSYLWVNVPKLTVSKLNLKKKLKIPSENLIFGSIGRFHPQKGFDILIKCFEELKLKNCTLILIGNGHEDYKYLESKDNKIKIIGQVNNVSNYYNIFDIGLLFSRWETFGYTLIESMKFNLPIISSIHIGNKDWISKFNIYKINLNKMNHIKNIIKKLHKNKPLRRSYNLEMFDYKRNCKKINNIYKKV